MSSGTARTARLGDFGGPSGRLNGDDRSAHGPGLGQSFGSAAPSWTGGIWGSSALGGTFGSGANDATRSKEETYPSTTAASFEGKTGSSSLVATSESDTWSNRQTTPWNSGDAISPALSNAHIHDTGSSPARSRTGNLHQTSQVLADKPRSTSPYYSALQAPIGQSAGNANKALHKHFLDPTSSTFTASRRSDDRVSDYVMPANTRAFPVSMAEDETHRHAQSIVGALNDGRGGLTSDFALSGGSAGLRNDVQPTHSLRADMQAPYSHYPPAASGVPSHRVSRSSNTSFSSSHSNSRNFDDIHRDVQQSELLASFGRVNLEDEGYYQRPNIPTSIASNIPGLSSAQTSYESMHRQALANPTRYTWNQDDGTYSNGLGTFTPDGLPEGTFAEQLSGVRLPRMNDQRSISPAGNDYRHRIHSPYYSTGGTPPAGSEPYRVPSRGGAVGRPPTSGHSALLDKKLRGLQQEQQSYLHPQANGMMMRTEPFQGQSTPHPYDYSPQNGYRVNPIVPYVPLPGLTSRPAPPRGPSRDQDLGTNLRSPLLEEFRSNAKTSKRYELKDIYNHVVEFSGDQHGSRFIQQKLETANSDEKDQVFRELRPNSLQLMADVFGNYVIQKFFEHGTQQQKTILAEQMKGHILNLSLQMYGCRVVQKALEHILVDQQAALVKELDVHVLKCVKDQNGNHVIQKAIERVPPEHIQFIINAFTGQVHSLATHPYGCRVIQRMLEYCQGKAQTSILQELHACTYALIIDQYGNYVTQHVIEHGKEEDRDKIINLITGQLVHFSKHKFASNVVEKSIQFGSDDQRREMIAILTALSSNGSSPVQSLIRDQYGNYVIQKLLGQMKGADLDRLVDCIKPQLAALKKYAYGKQISAIEKIICTSGTPSQVATSPPDTSAAPTPPLSNTEAHSPQSSSIPSTNNSTVEGPVKNESTGKTGSDEEQKVAIAATTS